MLKVTESSVNPKNTGGMAMAKTLISRRKLAAMAKKGMSQAEIARQLHVSRQAVNLRCDEMFGPGVITQPRKVTDASRFFTRIVGQLMGQQKALFLFWVLREAISKGYQVALPLAKHRIPQTLLVNGLRVWICVAKKPYPFGRTPLYHWEVNKTAADIFVCLGMREGHVERCLVIPSRGIHGKSSTKGDRVKIYLPPSDYELKPHDYPFAEYLDGWEAFRT